MHRRSFLRGLGATLVLPSTLGCALRHTAGRVERVGIQLYTLRDAARADLERTLGDIATIGYREVELLDSMGNFGMPAARLRQLLDRLHLRAPSTHIDTAALDDLPRLIGDAQTLGHEYLIVASLPDGSRATLDDYRRWADRLNAAGETVRRAGLWLGFHDEAWDFRPIDGQLPYDVLVERLDPARVRLQLDTGNAAIGGSDPLALMDRYADRYWLFHIKDAPQLGAAHDVELGEGIVDFRRLLARAGSLEGKHVYVEQESYPGAPLDSVRRDYAYLSSLTF
ncbi:MAG TPA: sugar phosphate isomerase/epimerase [Gemmatimonadaceae bacterium]|nr:sugar phosphate isomerase/epimerase [Gemmatimonadaceae bacterium]